jgi:hypothetical protein
MWVTYLIVHLFLLYDEGKEHCSLFRPKVLSIKIMTFHL